MYRAWFICHSNETRAAQAREETKQAMETIYAKKPGQHYKRLSSCKPTLQPFITKHENNTKVYTSDSQPRLREPHVTPKHPLRGPQQSLNNASNNLCNRLRSAVKQNVQIDLC